MRRNTQQSFLSRLLKSPLSAHHKAKAHPMSPSTADETWSARAAYSLKRIASQLIFPSARQRTESPATAVSDTSMMCLYERYPAAKTPIPARTTSTMNGAGPQKYALSGGSASRCRAMASDLLRSHRETSHPSEGGSILFSMTTPRNGKKPER